MRAFCVEKLAFMNIPEILSNPTKLRALTSLDKAEFDWLCQAFEPVWYRYNAQFTLEGKVRIKPLLKPRKNESLPKIEDKVFFVLYYLKTNSLQVVTGESFGISQAKVSLWFKCLFQLLNKTLEQANLTPLRDGEELGKLCVHLASKVIVIDGTERPVERPVDPEAQKETYSGKKKIHSIKNNLAVNLSGFILYLSQTVAGCVHDKTLCDMDPIKLETEIIILQDTGYQGHKPDKATIVQPKKKPRGIELTKEEKAENQKISSKRVTVEHLINCAKRLRIVKDKCRISSNLFQDLAMETACALHNLRTLFRGRVTVEIGEL